MNYASFILNLSIWVILLPLAVGSCLFKKLNNESRLVFFLVLIATIPQIITAFINDSPFRELIYNTYTPVEFIITFFIIGNKIKYGLFKLFVWVSIILFFILVISEIVSIGLQSRFLNEWVCTANISYLVWILLYILESTLNDIKLPNVLMPLFWYLSGLTLYSTCTIFEIALYYYIEKSQNAFIRNLWSIQGVFNIILYLFFAIGLYQNKQNVKRGYTQSI